MKSALRPLLLAVVVSALPAQSLAQTTTVYGYDVHGRLTHAGANSSNTTYYVLDGADNRGTRRCCEAIGGAQVLDDGFDPYFYIQTYADIRAAGMDPYQHWLQYGASENRWPNRYFNTAWYRTTYNIPASVNPLTDYHNSGQAGLNPSEKLATGRGRSRMDPLTHYLRWSSREFYSDCKTGFITAQTHL
jgi:hypothetical protein